MASFEKNDIYLYHERLSESRTPNSDENDPFKYTFPPCMYRRVPRWPNDGIETYRKEHYNKKQIKALRGKSLLLAQKELTEMLGHWPSEFSLNDLFERARDSEHGTEVALMFKLPCRIQKDAALKTQNLEAAKDHLLEAYRSKDPRVRALLEQTKTTSCVHKASKDPSRLPEMVVIIVPLLRDRLASDANLKLLFGDVSYIRSMVMDLGPNIAEPPAPGTFDYNIMEPYLNETKVKAAAKVCAECGTTAGKLSRCECKKAHYCSKECQKEAWIIHRPDCFNAQGKPVLESMLTKAATAIEKKEQAAAKVMTDAAQAKAKQRFDEFIALWDEDPSLVDEKAPDFFGTLQRVHLPGDGDYAIQVVTGDAQSDGMSRGIGLSLTMIGDSMMIRSMPLGIDSKKFGPCCGYLFSDPNNGDAKILLVYVLFYTHRLLKPECTGMHIKGIFVIDHVKGDKRKVAWWKLVPEPNLTAGSYNRLRWLSLYMRVAKAHAVPIAGDVELGIHTDNI